MRSIFTVIWRRLVAMVSFQFRRARRFDFSASLPEAETATGYLLVSASALVWLEPQPFC